MELQTLGSLLGFKGINTDFIPELLPPQDEPVYIKDGNNMLVKDGSIRKLKGTDYLNDISSQLGTGTYRNVLGIPIYRQWDADKYLMAITPRKLYYLKNDNEWYELGDISAGENDSVLTSGSIDDKFIFVVSDSSVVYYWDGSTFAALTLTAEGVTTLKARYLLEFQTHMYLLRTIEDGTENYQRIWPSDAGNIDNFTAANKLDLDSEGVIVGGKPLKDAVIVYLDKSIFRVDWDSTYGYGARIISDGIGLIASRTLCGEKDVHFFLSQEGLMILQRGDIPRSVSDQKFNKLILDEIDPVYYYKAAARYYPHLKHLYLSYPKSGSSFNDVQLIYDISTRELVSKKTLTNEYYSSYGTFEKDLSGLAADERKDYGLSFIPILGTKDGIVKEQKVNDYQDGVNNYETNIVIPPTFFKQRSRNKRLLQIDLLVEKFTDENITLGIDLANEMNENFGTYSYTLTGSGNQGIRRFELRSDDNDNGVDCFGKEFTTRIKDIDNPYRWDFHGIIYRGWYRGIK